MLEVRSSRSENAGPAVHAAGRWARQFLISRSGFEAAVIRATREPVELVRVRWRGRSRRVVVRQVLTESRVRNVQEPLDPGLFDPWAEASESLAVRTLQLSRCGDCGGEKRVRCVTCQGSARVSCDSCNGSGSVGSQRSGRMIACRACRGDGERRCSCRDGWVSCGTCGGKGKVEEWLEIREEVFDRGTVWRGRMVEEAPAELRNVLRRSDLAGTNPREDRLQEVAVQGFRSEITTVAYQLGGVAGSVQVQGWDGRIVENDSSRGPFERRRLRTLEGMAGAVLAGSALAVWYGARHAFFRSTPNYGGLWLLALVLGLCIVPLVLWWVLPAERRKGKGALASGLPALLVVLTQAGLAATGGPSLDHARAVAARGQLEEALRESAACFDLGVESEPAAAFHDQLQLGRVRQARDPQRAWEAAASLPFLTETGKEQARAHAMEVTIQAGAALQEKGEFAESALVLDSAPPELPADPIPGGPPPPRVPRGCAPPLEGDRVPPQAARRPGGCLQRHRSAHPGPGLPANTPPNTPPNTAGRRLIDDPPGGRGEVRPASRAAPGGNPAPEGRRSPGSRTGAPERRGRPGGRAEEVGQGSAPVQRRDAVAVMHLRRIAPGVLLLAWRGGGVFGGVAVVRTRAFAIRSPDCLQFGDSTARKEAKMATPDSTSP